MAPGFLVPEVTFVASGHQIPPRLDPLLSGVSFFGISPAAEFLPSEVCFPFHTIGIVPRVPPLRTSCTILPPPDPALPPPVRSFPPTSPGCRLAERRIGGTIIKEYQFIVVNRVSYRALGALLLTPPWANKSTAARRIALLCVRMTCTPEWLIKPNPDNRPAFPPFARSYSPLLTNFFFLARTSCNARLDPPVSSLSVGYANHEDKNLPIVKTRIYIAAYYAATLRLASHTLPTLPLPAYPPSSYYCASSCIGPAYRHTWRS